MRYQGVWDCKSGSVSWENNACGMGGQEVRN